MSTENAWSNREKRKSECPNEDTVDPRVQVELEKLNTATDLINRLEIDLDESRDQFQMFMRGSTERLKQLASKLGSCVDRARPYYEARMKAKELQLETQRAALRFERASSTHLAAKEMVRLSEESLVKEGWTFDPAWQEMLNHATIKVNEAEQERRVSKTLHQKASREYNEAEQKVRLLQQTLKRAVIKSSLSTRRSLLQLNNLANQHQLQLLPYFEMKAHFNQILEDQKKKIEQLADHVLKVKLGYAEALHNLEKISDEIHRRRKATEQCPMEERTAGVGAEAETTSSCNGLHTRESSAKPSSLALHRASLSELDDLTPLTPVTRSLPSNPSPDVPNTSVASLRTLAKTAVEKLQTDILRKERPVHRNENQAARGSGSELLEQYNTLLASSPVRDPGVASLRNPRDEMSDTESLASTADTLDDQQIECLLLDRVLEQDYKEIVESTEDSVATPP